MTKLKINLKGSWTWHELNNFYRNTFKNVNFFVLIKK